MLGLPGWHAVSALLLTSSMYTPPTGMCDVDPAEALSPEEAALDLVWVALHPRDAPGGHFYRARERIEW